jgi:hypothetical protein
MQLKCCVVVCALALSAVEALSGQGAGAGAYGGGITTGTISSTILNDGSNPKDPGIGVIQDQRLLVCYSWASAADFENNNVIKCRLSSDFGNTDGGWGTETTVFTPPANYTALFGEVHVLSDWTITISYLVEPNAGSGLSLNTNTVNFNTLTVSGNTITPGTPVQIATGNPLGGSGVYSQTGPVELSAGPSNLMMTVYGGATTFGVGAYFSSNKGATWGNFTTLIAPDGTHVDQWNETDCHAVPAGQPAGNAGRIYCLARHDLCASTCGYDLFYTDTQTGLSGWTSPVTVLPNGNGGQDGRPTTLIHPNGAMAFMSRWAGPETAYSISYPNSTRLLSSTWAAVTRLGPAATQNWYNAMVVLPDHSIGAVAVQQVSNPPIVTKVIYQNLVLTNP